MCVLRLKKGDTPNCTEIAQLELVLVILAAKFSYNICINARYVQKILSSFKVYNVGYMYNTGLQHRRCSIKKIV